jgi:hypothetical protein
VNGFDEHRVPHPGLDPSDGTLRIPVQLCDVDLDMRNRREPGGTEHIFHDSLVHAHGRSRDVRTRVRQTGHLQKSLERAVLSVGPVDSAHDNINEKLARPPYATARHRETSPRDDRDLLTYLVPPFRSVDLEVVELGGGEPLPLPRDVQRDDIVALAEHRHGLMCRNDGYVVLDRSAPEYHSYLHGPEGTRPAGPGRLSPRYSALVLVR